MEVIERQRIRAERLEAFKASAEFMPARDLDARADEEEITQQAIIAIGKVRAEVSAFGRRMQGPETVRFLQGTLNGIAAKYGARPVSGAASLHGCIGRMVDPKWWRRNLRRELLRKNENFEHANGAIRRAAQCYVSDFAMKRKAARAKANRETLESLEVVNELGQALNLQEVADKSVSNPALRRAELMTRCRGFEETAKFSGHDGVFLTLTCPSRFHQYSGGKKNKKWDGSTPKDGQIYLCAIWQKIRSAWNRAGFLPYGFRVAEPHHDGCPHWHILLFIAPADAGWFKADRLIAGRKDHGAGMIGIAGKYALKESPAEAGAGEHRFTAKMIDPSKGSATGYIAKYIAKNIDGLGANGQDVGLDYASGTTAAKGAARVRTWSQVHSIRQFQQIGGPSVTVWRELRKVKLQQQNDLFEAPRAAADRGLWSLFWVLQGGPEVARGALSLKPEYAQDQTGKYGEPVKRVWGVCGQDERGEFALQTKMHTWTVQRDGLALVNESEKIRLEVRALMAGADAWAVAHGFESASDFRETGEAFSPWTRVNNCTENDQNSQNEHGGIRANSLSWAWARPAFGPSADSLNRQKDIDAEKLDAKRGAATEVHRTGGKPTFEALKNEIFPDRLGSFASHRPASEPGGRRNPPASPHK